jgi:hypothetical protein
LIFFHQTLYLPILRKPAELFLGKNQFPVLFNLKNPAARFDNLGFRPEFFFKFVRQTGGPRPVISHAAVGDFELHRSPFA